MLKLAKYEFRKNIINVILLAVMIVILEGYTLISMATKSERHIVISVSLLLLGIFVGIFMIFIMAIQSYSKELASKYSYLSFMTPNSTYKIIGSKLICTLLVALIATIIGILFIMLDYNVFVAQYPDIIETTDTIQDMMNTFGYSVSNALMSIAVFLIQLWIGIFTAICIAYFAITLTATALANKKFRGIISLILFFVITFALNKLCSYLPSVDIGTGVINDILLPLPTYIVNVIFMIAAFIGSGLLLDKKVSL